ncbi:hypothetical protein LTR05_007367 [Lithohypha guttulata]|uniref:Class II aldolase/adducin N-terminal domain-containing protein n=1 Tax=Lithohypha guttulata TaxID=1690604 RepID=A0AAN7Y4B7_9EURO|nr:hypothetical protein LTR05_007367 [Lithohypha guttulata]
MAPALIRSHEDLVQYHVSDGSPVEANPPRGYVERYIHSEIYKRYPTINSVVHSHSKAIIPYGITGTSTPVFDIAKHYQADDIPDLLIRNTRLGEALASQFAHSDANEDGTQGESARPAVLMRGHGVTITGTRIEEAVFRAIYMQDNAEIETTSLLLRAAHPSGPNEGSIIQYLSPEEAAGAAGMTQWAWERAWALWIKEVEAVSIYSRE